MLPPMSLSPAKSVWHTEGICLPGPRLWNREIRRDPGARPPRGRAHSFLNVKRGGHYALGWEGKTRAHPRLEAVLFRAEGKILAGRKGSQKSPDRSCRRILNAKKGTVWSPSKKQRGAIGQASAPLSPSQVSPYAEGAITD
jgi:hypothetical protein